MKTLAEKLEAKTDTATALQILTRHIAQTTDATALRTLLNAAKHLVKSTLR